LAFPGWKKIPTTVISGISAINWWEKDEENIQIVPNTPEYSRNFIPKNSRYDGL